MAAQEVGSGEQAGDLVGLREPGFPTWFCHEDMGDSHLPPRQAAKLSAVCTLGEVAETSRGCQCLSTLGPGPMCHVRDRA